MLTVLQEEALVVQTMYVTWLTASAALKWNSPFSTQICKTRTRSRWTWSSPGQSGQVCRFERCLPKL